MNPEEILEATRERLREYAGDDADKWWYANRFVFARLQLDERRTKTDIKKKLIESDQPCRYCGKPFESAKGICIHRIDGARGYHLDNCALMHADCHEKFHIENPMQGRSKAGSAARVAEAVTVKPKESKRYEGKAFIYWWDITPNEAENLEGYEYVCFIQKDTGNRCRIPVAALMGFFTEERRTSRGKGNWGIKVLAERPGELAFEPAKGMGDWLFLPVSWRHEDQPGM